MQNIDLLFVILIDRITNKNKYMIIRK